MTFEQAQSRARSILADGKWNHNFYSHEEMVSLIARVMSMDAPTESENQIKPISAAPKDRPILIAWGSKASGCMGFTVGRMETRKYTGDSWVHESGERIELGGYCIFGWYELPPIPKEICVDKA